MTEIRQLLLSLQVTPTSSAAVIQRNVQVYKEVTIGAVPQTSLSGGTNGEMATAAAMYRTSVLYPQVCCILALGFIRIIYVLLYMNFCLKLGSVLLQLHVAV